MIVLIIWDGLRPDMITAERTPFLHSAAGGGAFCEASHAAFPTATRINSASLSTGCYPGRHGIVDNSLYVPAIDPSAAISCADWRALQRMADLEGGRLVTVPTLGETLRACGRRMASAGSGSPGTTYLTNPTLTGPVVNWALAWPASAEEEVARRCGAFLGPESTSMERTEFVLRAVTDYLLPVARPDLLTLWLTEPDHTQHSDGLCAPAALSTLLELDRQLEDLVAALDRLGEHTYVLLSDHGFSTIGERVTPDRALVEAGLKDSLRSTDVIRDGNSIYLNGSARARLGDLVRTLADQPWIGGLFVRDDHLNACPGAMPQTEVFGSHRRSAELMFAYRWSSEPNKHGVPGSVTGSSRNAATHGSASPYDIHNCLVAWGKGIARGITSAVPCGIVDVAPTALHLLGIGAPDAMQGRVLHELLEGGPPPETVTVRRETQEWDLPASSGTRRQVARYSIVDGHRYLDQVSM